jgi:hypothetical protein
MISSMFFVFKIVTLYDKGVFLDRTMGGNRVFRRSVSEVGDAL